MGGGARKADERTGDERTGGATVADGPVAGIGGLGASAFEALPEQPDRLIAMIGDDHAGPEHDHFVMLAVIGVGRGSSDFRAAHGHQPKGGME